jgi:oxalate decarboxylase
MTAQTKIDPSPPEETATTTEQQVSQRKKGRTATEDGDIGPVAHSANLGHKRMEEARWTQQIVGRELPSSKNLAGVEMELAAGSFRELHWHTANQWAYMLYGNARVTVLNPDGTIFVNDVDKGDIWFSPAGFPHSVQGLGPDGCEYLLVFDEGLSSDYKTFLVSDWVAQIPPEVLSKEFGRGRSAIAKLPGHELYMLASELPRSLAPEGAAGGSGSVGSLIQYTFKMAAMRPTKKIRGGEIRVVDSHNFPASTSIAAGLVSIEPGGRRELHWHPNASEWQFYIAGKARMTVFMPTGRTRTVDFRAHDVGFVPAVAGHYIENTGQTDLVFLEVFKAASFMDFSLNNWSRRLPETVVE